jgi:2-C-methyl-D-erythritol 4-phosphate cytidylyltransferase
MVISVIIPVAGLGKRFGGSTPKQYLAIGDKPIITLTVEKFLSLAEIDYGVVVVAEEEKDTTYNFLQNIEGFNTRFKIISGGVRRQDSVYNGLQHIPSNTDVVIVHDGVRPLITSRIIQESIHEASRSGACVVAVPVKETIKRVNQYSIEETLPRSQLWQAQTPQSFKYSILNEAHKKARLANYYSTDESALVEWAGYPVKVVRGEYSNLKITTAEDLTLARLLYEEDHLK